MKLGTNLTGSGTSASPFKAQSTGTVNSDGTTNWGTVTYPGPITSIAIDYWSNASQTSVNTSGMQVFLTGMSFSSSYC